MCASVLRHSRVSVVACAVAAALLLICAVAMYFAAQSMRRGGVDVYEVVCRVDSDGMIEIEPLGELSAGVESGALRAVPCMCNGNPGIGVSLRVGAMGPAVPVREMQKSMLVCAAMDGNVVYVTVSSPTPVQIRVAAPYRGVLRLRPERRVVANPYVTESEESELEFVRE